MIIDKIMSLIETIINDQIQARKNRQELELSVLQVLLSELKNEKIKLNHELDETEIIGVVSRQIKRLKETYQDFEKGNRQDLLEKTKQEIEILEKYLPQQLSNEELEKIITKVIEQQPEANFGQIMGQVMAKVKGQADGNVVREIVNKILQK